jgi:outer membrane receptor for ferric coprogen and ferric-rhodotorulic acid
MFYLASVSGDDASAFATHITSKTNQMIGEAQLSGPFTLFGRDHELTVGANYGRTHLKADEHDVDANGYYDVSFQGALAGTTVRPSLDYTFDTNNQNFSDTQKSLYAGTRWSLMDDLHWIVGARMLSADGKGLDYGVDHHTREHGKVTPYTGLVYDLNDQWSVYGSWTQIFSPQYKVGTDGRMLDPLEGTSEEIGIKGSLPCSRPSRKTSPNTKAWSAARASTARWTTRAMASNCKLPVRRCRALTCWRATPTCASTMTTATVPANTCRPTASVAWRPTACRACQKPKWARA